jgi:NitT/TauT family transport system substrate-binding protein
MKTVPQVLMLVAAAALFCCGCRKESDGEKRKAGSVAITVGHVEHDHHLALYVAADNAGRYAQESGVGLKTDVDRKFYRLTERGREIAEVEVVVVGGGSRMPTALAQGVIEVGFGGVAAVLASVDSGAPIKLIAPLHYKGDMFVVKPDFTAKTWKEFVELAKRTEEPIRIGYKDPVAVAKLVFEEALKHEGIRFGEDPGAEGLQVRMINVKGGGKLNVALAGGLVDGYVGNNPFPAIGVEQGILRVVCDLEDLPPGTFRNHPCCCIAASEKAIREKPDAIVDLLVLFMQATETINTDLDAAVKAATRWLGTSEAVERMSIATSGYSMEDSLEWHKTMTRWIEAMTGLGAFTGKLNGLKPEEVPDLAYDFSLLRKAKQKLANRGKTK